MILFIDNYDSYVYNLVQYISRTRTDVVVVRNDALKLDELQPSLFERIILSPGPCGPLEAGICNDVWRHCGHLFPILGICLGHQCLGHVFGMTVERAPEAVHGSASPVYPEESVLYAGLPRPFQAGRYHSLVVTGTPPPPLKVNARLADGTIMGLEHRALPLFGVQFHPESILTPDGRQLLTQFLAVEGRNYPGWGKPEALGVPPQAGIVRR
ncbi:MAG: anthranilate synthase component II [Myxococcota bacterium]